MSLDISEKISVTKILSIDLNQECYDDLVFVSGNHR